MADAASTADERNVITLTAIAGFSARFFEVMYPTLAVSMAWDLRLPIEQVIGWSFFGYLLLGLGVIPASFLADRVGLRRALVVAMAGAGVSALAAAEASPGTGIAACLGAIGLFGSICHPAGMPLISQAATVPVRALKISGISGNLAVAVTPALIAVLCSQFGWQTAWAIVGFVMCAVAALCPFLSVEDGPEDPPIATETAESAADVEGSVPLLLFGLLCTTAMLAGISYRANLLVQPAYFAERVPTVGFGIATSLVLACGVLGQYGGAALTGRYELRWLYWGAHAIGLPALLAMATMAGLPMIAAAILFTVSSFAVQPIEQSLFARFTPGRWRKASGRIQFLLHFAVGSVAVALLACGQARGDLRVVLFYLAGAVTVVLAVMSIFVACSGSRTIRKARTRWAMNGGPRGA